MTVSEAIAALKGAKRIAITWGGFSMRIDPADGLAMAAFGDFKVAHIHNSFELNTYEIEVVTKFVKEVKM